jgi:uncharacterized protein (DUF697 family)
MTHEQEEKCRRIIHGHAVLAGAGNAVPIPGVDVLADIAVLTRMTMALGDVFERSITADLAKNFVIALIKKQLTGRVAKAVIKLVPLAGWAAGPVIGVVMTEAAGWELANRLDRRVY